MSDNNLGNTALGVGAGFAAYKGTKQTLKKGLKPYYKWAIKGLSEHPTQTLTLKTAVEDAFVKSGLKEKGYNIHNLSNTKIRDELYNRMTAFTGKGKGKCKNIGDLVRKITERCYKSKIAKSLDNTLNGRNAFCQPGAKRIVVNLDKMPKATFHEMGHALNFSGKGIGKILSKIRPIAFLATIPVAVGLLKRKKADGEQPKGVFDKITTFIKDNAGKLTFAAFVPTILEEGLASIRGEKLAKQSGLSKELLKKVRTGDVRAWTTYVMGALIATGATKLAIHVRDKVAGPKNS